MNQDDMMPAISWRQLRDMLEGLADTPAKTQMVEHLVEGLRKQSRFLTPEGCLMEAVYIGAVLLDVRFQPSESDLNTSDASCLSSPSRQPSRG